ncbi:nucleoside triphosphate pyrophosphohydrolase [Kribbella sp. NPDC056861]|uniref:nucleoside triphosphate pyrophosphohydrolase n=1 Tax=Kribbella sp. NPDC056861 TaxID=3154857 RepID=UPI00343A6887
MSEPEAVADSKLVRDLIPDLVRANGEVPVTYQADSAEYRHRLRDKLLEEVDEFLTADPAGAIEELADVLEVVYALAADLGTDQSTLDRIRHTKAAERGAFADRVVWQGVR